MTWLMVGEEWRRVGIRFARRREFNLFFRNVHIFNEVIWNFLLNFHFFFIHNLSTFSVRILIVFISTLKREMIKIGKSKIFVFCLIIVLYLALRCGPADQGVAPGT